MKRLKELGLKDYLEEWEFNCEHGIDYANPPRKPVYDGLGKQVKCCDVDAGWVKAVGKQVKYCDVNAGWVKAVG